MADRKPMMAGNWKMNHTHLEAIQVVQKLSYRLEKNDSEDVEVVVRLRNAGAVLMAKLATGLFAQGDQWYRGRTNNPWDVRRGSSGSSAGPASATAGGCVAFGIGTETGGSIVSPARECGLSALRPTFGRVSRYGGMVLAWSQDRVGPICRTIEDCVLLTDVWVKDKGDWRAIRRHSTPAPAGECNNLQGE